MSLTTFFFEFALLAVDKQMNFELKVKENVFAILKLNSIYLKILISQPLYLLSRKLKLKLVRTQISFLGISQYLIFYFAFKRTCPFFAVPLLQDLSLKVKTKQRPV